MKYHYQIRRINWKDEKERYRWFGDALMFGHNFDYVVTEINDIEDFSFYIGDNFFDKSRTDFTERELRILNWLKDNHPELLI